MRHSILYEIRNYFLHGNILVQLILINLAIFIIANLINLVFFLMAYSPDSPIITDWYHLHVHPFGLFPYFVQHDSFLCRREVILPIHR